MKMGNRILTEQFLNIDNVWFNTLNIINRILTEQFLNRGVLAMIQAKQLIEY